MKRNFPFFPALALGLSFAADLAAENTVEIIRDSYGVPHVYAVNQADGAFGVAYAQCEDNLDFILQSVVRARGEGAKAMGRGEVENDFRFRLFRGPQVVAKLYESTSPEARESLDGYAEGVNRYLREHPDEKPEWFDRMTGHDEMALLKMYQFTQQMTGVKADLSNVAQARRETDQAGGDLDASNMWAVGPSRSKNGETMLFTDPHLPWTGSSRWHEFQLTVGERWVYGVTFFGFAGVALGFNADVAWGGTNNAADTADVYRETLNSENPDQYLYEGEWREIETETIEIEIKGQETVKRLARRTHHGPIVREDRATNTAFSARLAGFESADLAKFGLADLRARSVRDMHESNRNGDQFKGNRIAADRHGDIGYFYFASTHERDDSINWRAPVDGSTKATEWGPRIAWDRLPATYNPSSGFLVNCNNNPYTVTTDCPIKPQDYPKHLTSQGTSLQPKMRAHRATELIDAAPKLDFADMERISMDVKALNASDLRDAILRAYEELGARAPDPNGDMRAAIEILREWDGLATVDNQALPILGVCAQLAGKKAPRQPNPRQVLTVFSEALNLMKQQWGSVKVAWGDVHVTRRGDRDFPMAGAGSERALDPFVTLYMTGAGAFEDNKWLVDRGSSWMMLVKYHQGKVEAKTILPWGNSEDPESKHYADQAPLFAKRQYKQARLTRAEVEADAESRRVLRR